MLIVRPAQTAPAKLWSSIPGSGNELGSSKLRWWYMVIHHFHHFHFLWLHLKVPSLVEWPQLAALEIKSTSNSAAWPEWHHFCWSWQNRPGRSKLHLSCAVDFSLSEQETDLRCPNLWGPPNEVQPKLDPTWHTDTQRFVPRKRVASWSKVVKNDTYSAAADASQVGCLRRYQNCSNWERQLPWCGWSSYWLPHCGIILKIACGTRDDA